MLCIANAKLVAITDGESIVKLCPQRHHAALHDRRYKHLIVACSVSSVSLFPCLATALPGR